MSIDEILGSSQNADEARTRLLAAGVNEAEADQLVGFAFENYEGDVLQVKDTP